MPTAAPLKSLRDPLLWDGVFCDGLHGCHIDVRVVATVFVEDQVASGRCNGRRRRRWWHSDRFARSGRAREKQIQNTTSGPHEVEKAHHCTIPHTTYTTVFLRTYFFCPTPMIYPYPDPKNLPRGGTHRSSQWG